MWTPTQYNAVINDFNYSGLAPLLLVNPVSGAILVELNAIKKLDFHLGNGDDRLDVSETAASPARTVPIFADGGSSSEAGNTVVLGDAYAGLPHSAFAAIFGPNGTTVIGVAITYDVGGVEMTDRYTNFQNFVGHFSFNSLANELSLTELALTPGRADPIHSSLTSLVRFAGPQETAVLTLTARDSDGHTRPFDPANWTGAGTFSPNAGTIDAHGVLTTTYTPPGNTVQTVTASFDAITVSTSVPFVAMNIWTNDSGGDWATASNWSGNIVPPSGEAVWIGGAGNYTVSVTSNQSIYGLGTMDTTTLQLGAVLTVNGFGQSVLAGDLVINNGGGVLLAQYGMVEIDGTLINNGNLWAANGATINVAGNIAGALHSGVINVDAAYLNVAGTVSQTINIRGAGVVHLEQAANGIVDFQSPGTLVLDVAPASGLSVRHFDHADNIILTNLDYSSDDTLSWNAQTNTLTIIDGAISESIRFGEAHSLSDFTLTADPRGSGGIMVGYNSNTINYASASIAFAVPLNSDLSSGKGGIDAITDSGIALVTSATTAYFFVNGHLIPVSGPTANYEAAVVDVYLGSGINNNQTIVLTGEQSFSKIPLIYTGSHVASSGLNTGNGGNASFLGGPSELWGPHGSTREKAGGGYGINDSNEVVGYFRDQDTRRYPASLNPQHEYGFVYKPGIGYVMVDAGDSLHNVHLPQSVNGGAGYVEGGRSNVFMTVLTDINNAGVAVGWYMDGQRFTHAFVFDSNDNTFTYLPDIPQRGTVAMGINEAGMVVGWYTPRLDVMAIIRPQQYGGNIQSFVYDSNTHQYITTNFVVAGYGNQIALTGINDDGQVTGTAFQTLFVADLHPSVTIGHGGTLYVTTPTSQTVTFDGGIGMLVLADPANFHGVINGFRGTAPDAAHSDVINIRGYDFFSPDFQTHYIAATGVLTIQQGALPTVELIFQSYSGNLVFASDGNGGTLIFDPPSGPADIAAGQLLEIASADSSAVTFTGGNGTLQLDDPSSFTGTIARISDTGNALDLGGFAAATTTVTTGSGSYRSDINITTLTVTDSSDHTTATLKLAGDLSAVNWTVSDDHHGGALVVAPPLAPTAPVTLASTSASETLFGTAQADQFTFAANSSHDTIIGFTAGIDHIDLSALASIVNASDIESFLANHVTAVGIGDTLIRLDFNDSILLRNVAATSLHAGDFIVHA